MRNTRRNLAISVERALHCFFSFTKDCMDDIIT